MEQILIVIKPTLIFKNNSNRSLNLEFMEKKKDNSNSSHILNLSKNSSATSPRFWETTCCCSSSSWDRSSSGLPKTNRIGSFAGHGVTIWTDERPSMRESRLKSEVAGRSGLELANAEDDGSTNDTSAALSYSLSSEPWIKLKQFLVGYWFNSLIKTKVCCLRWLNRK